MVVILNNQLISLETKISGKPAVFLLDSGASHNFFPLNLCKTNGLNIDIKEQFSVRVADGLEVLAIGKVKCLVDLGLLKTALTFYILDCDALYVLGIPFLQTVNPIIDQTARSVSVYTTEGLSLLKVSQIEKTSPSANQSQQINLILGFVRVSIYIPY